jgi:hypothetical protein
MVEIDESLHFGCDGGHGLLQFSGCSWTASMTRKPNEARISGMLTSTLRLAFLFLLLTTVALSWFYYDTFNRREDWVGRFAAANAVLDDYQKIARLTLQEINALDDRLEGGEP